jgi:flagellar biosynthesis protein FlhF
METKTYFASSVQAAMETARRELGPDAMLVTSRPSPESARAFGRLEVTFAWDAAAFRDRGEEEPGRTLPVMSAMSLAAESRRQPREAGLEDIRLEISELRAALGRNGAVSARNEAGNPAQAVPAVNNAAVQALLETGMETEMARQIVTAAGGSGQTGGILNELTTRIPTAAFAPLQAEESRTLAFVGAPGRGKTTSLVKVAVRFGLANRIPTRIFAAGTHGVGAVEQLARYAAILGVPFQAVESFEGLNLALQGDRWKGLVLIDTPGLVFSDRQEMDAMTTFFSRRTDIEKHLVIRAEARCADMRNMMSRFAGIKPSRLLFTGVDEVRGLGAAAETMIRSGLGAAFFGTGPQIPEDLEEVNVAKLARSLWKANAMAARAA